MKVHGSSLIGIAGAVLVLGVLEGCDRAGERDNIADAAVSTGDSNEVAPGNAPAGARDKCPLLAAEVGEIVGVAMQQDVTTCMFEPQPGIEPRVLFTRHALFVCSEAVVNDPSFWLEPYDGLGVRAYASSSGGNLLVCTDPPFEIKVDIAPNLADVVADSDAASAAARASERAAAEQLVRLILAR